MLGSGRGTLLFATSRYRGTYFWEIWRFLSIVTSLDLGISTFLHTTKGLPQLG